MSDPPLSDIDFKSIEKFTIQFQSRCMSDPSLADIDLKNKMLESN